MSKEEGSWQDCLDLFSCIKVSVNKSKIKSLIETAVGRNGFLAENLIKETNVNYLFEGYYSSALELLHALTLSVGYKVNNHFCLGYYLRDVLGNKELFRIFDDLRFKRNLLIYYGKKMEFEIAKDSIKKCKKLFDEVLKLLH